LFSTTIYLLLVSQHSWIEFDFGFTLKGKGFSLILFMNRAIINPDINY
jgi:hypothetical protein